MEPLPAGPFSDEEREQLILAHLPQVRLIARKIHQHIEGHVDLDDLISTGIVGLIAAIDRFDPDRGLKLCTYAEHKIRGQILDSLRDLDPATRKARSAFRAIEAARTELQQQLGRTPDSDEVAEAAGMSLSTYRSAVSACRNSTLLSLDAPTPGTEHQPGDALCTKDCFSSSSTVSADEAMAETELLDALRSALHHLRAEDEELLNLHYAHGMSMLALAEVLHTPEWKLRARRDKALRTLRKRLAPFASSVISEPIQACLF